MTIAAEQLSITDLHPCPKCHGAGVVRDRDGEPERCRVCDGAGTVDYDPADESIPF